MVSLQHPCIRMEMNGDPFFAEYCPPTLFTRTLTQMTVEWETASYKMGFNQGSCSQALGRIRSGSFLVLTLFLVQTSLRFGCTRGGRRLRLEASASCFATSRSWPSTVALARRRGVKCQRLGTGSSSMGSGRGSPKGLGEGCALLHGQVGGTWGIPGALVHVAKGLP